MKATLLLADAATANPDGTISLLRGFISKVNVPADHPAGAPIPFQAALIARLEIDKPGDSGSSQVEVFLKSEEGTEIIPPLTMTAKTQSDKHNHVLVINAHVLLPKVGRYNFFLHWDGKEIGKWPFEAQTTPKSS